MSVGAAGKMGPVPGVWPRPEPFAPRADPAVLEDLRARLRATRWPDAPEDAGWSLGTDLDYLRELVAYWADEFDWTTRKPRSPRLPRYRVRLGGLRIHFVHARAAAGGRAGTAAAGLDPRLARLVLALHQGHRPADRPRCPRSRPR